MGWIVVRGGVKNSDQSIKKSLLLNRSSVIESSETIICGSLTSFSSHVFFHRNTMRKKMENSAGGCSQNVLVVNVTEPKLLTEPLI